jgi:hypothetical protein
MPGMPAMWRHIWRIARVVRRNFVHVRSLQGEHLADVQGGFGSELTQRRSVSCYWATSSRRRPDRQVNNLTYRFPVNHSYLPTL